jgi:hypothetical protein
MRLLLSAAFLNGSLLNLCNSWTDSTSIYFDVFMVKINFTDTRALFLEWGSVENFVKDILRINFARNELQNTRNETEEDKD